MGGGSTYPVELSIVQENEFVLSGVVNKTTVLVDLSTGRDENRNRPKYELAIVLDKSGSMGGNKLDNSKLAVEKIIENTSSDDILHFITYDTNVTVEFEHASTTRKEELLAAVRRVRQGSATNLSGGLERAYALIGESAAGPAFQKRVFLFSDGVANAGHLNRPCTKAVEHRRFASHPVEP